MNLDKDFCSKCGILLPVAVTTEIPLCRPCKESQAAEKSYNSSKKECDLKVSNSDYEAEIKSSVYKKDKSKPTVEKVSKVKPKVGKKQQDSTEHRSVRFNMECQMVLESSKTDVIEVDESDFTLVSRTRSSKHECPEVKEEAVDESIRKQWEIQQADMKRQLVVRDTPEIAALVSGLRRKASGRHFYVGGVDISFIKDNNIDACACLTVLEMPSLRMVYQKLEMIKLEQPYIPGFLAFRECPALIPLFKALEYKAPCYMPDIVLVDGNGTLHPRGFGLACQLGLMLGIPTIGVAKTLITAQGIVDDDSHKRKKQTLTKAGDGFDLVADSGKVLGKCLRVHDKAPNPIYVSLGHNVTLESAVWIALECSKYRIPEPVRKADLDSREYLRQGKTRPEEYIE